jgi:hypothetical protein
MNAQVQLSRMIRQSADVMIHPSVRTFNYYGARASDSETLLYVTVAVVLIGLLNQLIFGHLDLIGLAFSVVNQLFGFYLFAGITYFVGRQFGGMGSFPTVAYTFALFYVPILVLAAVLLWALILLPIGLPSLLLIRLVELAALAFFAYQAVQAALYIRRPRDAALTVLIGLAALWLIQLVFGGAGLGV